MIDTRAVEAASGWRLQHVERTTSTMEDAARLRAHGAGPRTAVVAEEQAAGRGRDGRAFASPPGGLYVSMLVGAGPLDLPGPLVAASALAAAEAVEQATGLKVDLKWPNDLWIGGRKVGGLLLESVGGERPVVVVGVGINVRGVPAALPEDLRRRLDSLDRSSGREVSLEGLLLGLLARMDRRLSDLRSAVSRTALGSAWAARLALRGERVSWIEAGARRTGRLIDAGLEDGLDVLDDAAGRRRLRGEHIQELRPLDGPPGGEEARGAQTALH